MVRRTRSSSSSTLPSLAKAGFKAADDAPIELQAITAVFLGGAATTGGKGTIVGTVTRD